LFLLKSDILITFLTFCILNFKSVVGLAVGAAIAAAFVVSIDPVLEPVIVCPYPRKWVFRLK